MQSAPVNLLVNARDAVGGSGRITIETSNAVIEEEFIGHAGEGLEPGRYVMLAVRDSGVGMGADAIGKMFDPFYSTKPVGQGTGLGLSMFQGFVEQSRGAITVESTPGRGTQLRLYFPAHHGPDLPPPQETDKAASAVSGVGSSAGVLLVEDEAGVRTVVERMLKSCGYRVQTAIGGDGAFELCRSNGAFDLVITDVVMPGELQVPAMVDVLRSLHPGTRFLFINGYDSATGADSARLGPPRAARLMKPFSQEQLLDAVEQTLKQLASRVSARHSGAAFGCQCQNLVPRRVKDSCPAADTLR